MLCIIVERGLASFTAKGKWFHLAKISVHKTPRDSAHVQRAGSFPADRCDNTKLFFFFSLLSSIEKDQLDLIGETQERYPDGPHISPLKVELKLGPELLSLP